MSEDNVIWGAHSPNVVISQDGLTIMGTSGGFGSARANIGRFEGKRAFEIEIVNSAGSSRYGVGDAAFNLANYLGTNGNALGIWNLNIQPVSGAFAKIGADVNPPQAAGTRYLILIDFGALKGWILRNGIHRTPGANPEEGTGFDFTFTAACLPLYPAASSYSPGDAMRLHSKFADFGSPLPASWNSWAEADGASPPPPPPPTGQNGVGFLGDSLDYYMDQNGNSSAAIFDFSPTFNAGVGSDTTAGMLSRLPALIALKPKAIFILGGVNDIALGLTRDQTRDNIIAMVNACMAADVIPYVEAILPVAPGYPNYGGATVMNAEIAARNTVNHAALKSLKGGQWIDWGPSLIAADYVSGDFIHLLASGYVKRATALNPLINLYR